MLHDFQTTVSLIGCHVYFLDEENRINDFQENIRTRMVIPTSKLKLNNTNSIVTFILEWVGEKSCTLLAEVLILELLFLYYYSVF